MNLLQHAHHQVPYYQSNSLLDHPYLKHAIFGRQGGVSQSPYDTLNLGQKVDDEPSAVAGNLVRACQALDIQPQDTVTTQQVHQATVLTATANNQQPVLGQADGLVTQTPNIFLLMRFADCTPLLLSDSVHQVIGIAHAGWRGTMANVAGATVQAMAELGAKPRHITAVIGPAIGPCCYEVGPEVIAQGEAVLPDGATLFDHQKGRVGHAHFDMWSANQRLLTQAGVNQIIEAKCCTVCHRDLFFSHRGDQGRTGRFGAMIGLVNRDPKGFENP